MLTISLILITQKSWDLINMLGFDTWQPCPSCTDIPSVRPQHWLLAMGAVALVAFIFTLAVGAAFSHWLVGHHHFEICWLSSEVMSILCKSGGCEVIDVGIDRAFNWSEDVSRQLYLDQSKMVQKCHDAVIFAQPPCHCQHIFERGIWWSHGCLIVFVCFQHFRAQFGKHQQHGLDGRWPYSGPDRPAHKKAGQSGSNGWNPKVVWKVPGHFH